MNLRTFSAGLIAGLFLASGSHAADYRAGDIQVDKPWARATVPGQQAGGGFLKLENKGAADRLLSASADVSQTVELHTMAMEGNVMRMRQVDGIDLPAGKAVELKPGGYHVMFIGLKAPLKAGDSFPVKLRFEKAGELTVQMKVEAMGPGAAGMHGGMSGGMQGGSR